MDKFKDLNELYTGWRKLHIQDRQSMIECNRKDKDITLHFKNLDIQLEDQRRDF
jgi:hypothetical protein